MLDLAMTYCSGVETDFCCAQLHFDRPARDALTLTDISRGSSLTTS